MRTRFAWIAALAVAALMLGACQMVNSPASEGKGVGTTPTASAANLTPGAGGPRAGGTRGAFGTPGAGRPAGNTTPAARGTATPNGAAMVAPTAVPRPDIADSGTSAPTAVPVPTVVMPTVAPAATAAPTAATPPTIPYTPVPMQPVPTLAPIGTPMSVEALRGKIIFMSDRDGYPQLYVMEPDGSNQRPCNCTDVLEELTAREMSSPDGKQFLFYKVAGGGRGGGDQQIWAHNNDTGYEAVVTGAAPGFPTIDYDAVWSPDSRHIAFVSQTNRFDEIYLYDSVENSNVRLTESASEWYKHPSFSPDGSQIAYWTNVDNVERKQVWVMNLDGSNKHNLSQNNYNDYSPIWVK